MSEIVKVAIQKLSYVKETLEKEVKFKERKEKVVKAFQKEYGITPEKVEVDREGEIKAICECECDLNAKESEILLNLVNTIIKHANKLQCESKNIIPSNITSLKVRLIVWEYDCKEEHDWKFIHKDCHWNAKEKVYEHEFIITKLQNGLQFRIEVIAHEPYDDC